PRVEQQLHVSKDRHGAVAHAQHPIDEIRPREMECGARHSLAFVSEQALGFVSEQTFYIRHSDLQEFVTPYHASRIITVRGQGFRPTVRQVSFGKSPFSQRKPCGGGCSSRGRVSSVSLKQRAGRRAPACEKTRSSRSKG